MEHEQTSAPTAIDDAETKSFERLNLRTERQRLALEVRLKRRELATQAGKTWRERLANPLMLAVVGGFITIMASIAQTWYTARENQIAETARARASQESLQLTAKLNQKAETQRATIAQESAARTLQADLIKKAVEAEVDDAKKNLKFLAEVGLIPEYADRVTNYLKEHPNDIPTFAPAQAASTGWRDSPPDQAFCFQREREGDDYRFLVRCFETNEGCVAVQAKDRGKRTNCIFVTGLRASDQWKNAGRGGINDSWYRYSKAALQKPFPQLP